MEEFRARNKIHPDLMSQMVGKMLRPDDLSVKLTGPVRILKPDGTPLCVYLPGAISKELRDASFPTLHELQGSYTSNRGLASGAQRVKGVSKTTYARSVDSAIIGSFDRSARFDFCRLTAWTGAEMEKWQGLWPLLQEIARHLQEHVPERYAAQARAAQATAPEWVIPGTPFTTVTVNNTYATGVHTDKGDLDAGFSTIAVFKNGDYEGGTLCFPEYRVGVDLQDCDLILMDAHEWHGNIEFTPQPERDTNGRLLEDPGFERISIVTYFRTAMESCGSAKDEAERQVAFREQRQSALLGE